MKLLDMTEVRHLVTRTQRALDLLEIGDAIDALESLSELVSDLEADEAEVEFNRDAKTLVDFFPKGIMGGVR